MAGDDAAAIARLERKVLRLSTIALELTIALERLDSHANKERLDHVRKLIGSINDR